MTNNNKAKQSLKKRQEAEHKAKEADKKKQAAKENEEAFFQREGEAAGQDLAGAVTGATDESQQAALRYKQAKQDKEAADKQRQEAKQLDSESRQLQEMSDRLKREAESE